MSHAKSLAIVKNMASNPKEKAFAPTQLEMDSDCIKRDCLPGIVELDSFVGKMIGFTTDRFDGYLWKNYDSITISFIASKQKGNFRQLVERILELGLAVEVPTPLPNMRRIVEKNGYVMTTEYDASTGEFFELWTLKPKK